VGLLGLTFKAGTDDRRDSPAVKIAQMLILQNVEVHAYDPTVSPNSDALDLTGIYIHKSAFECIDGVDVILVATEWNEFEKLEAHQVIKRIRSKNIVDARNILDEDYWKSNGFRYIGVGR
jgi:UDPglucose 6-dehydrogenase